MQRCHCRTEPVIARPLRRLLAAVRNLHGRFPPPQVVDAAMSGTLRWRDGPNAGLQASFRASLEHDGLLPVSTIDVRGDR